MFTTIKLFVLLFLLHPAYNINFLNAADGKKIFEIQNMTTYADAVEKSAPAVVSIQTTQEIITTHPMLDDPIFKFFFNNPKDEKEKIRKRYFQQGLGSGVIVDKKGYVLTNNHVIREAGEISIKFSSGVTTEVELIGSDARTDLAILKIKDKKLLKNLPVILLGNSDKLRVGDIVLAIGNPFGFDNTVTQGIISALGSVSARSNEHQFSFGGWLDSLIQTDAAINPGNSGGALTDVNGNLIGINLAIVSRSGGSQGIGFAIPVNFAKEIMEQLIKKGYIIRGWLGAQLGEMTREIRESTGFNNKYGIYVQATIKYSPAQKSGILPGDIITKINNIEVKNVSEAIKSVSILKPNENYNIEVFRKFKFLTFSVLIGQMPKEK